MKLDKTFSIFLIFLLSLPVFIWLETGFSINSASDLIKPAIFGLSLTSSLNNIRRRVFLIFSLGLFGLMVLFYLFWQIEVSNWFGSLGFGILLAYFIGLLPEITKKGFIEKL